MRGFWIEMDGSRKLLLGEDSQWMIPESFCKERILSGWFQKGSVGRGFSVDGSRRLLLGAGVLLAGHLRLGLCLLWDRQCEREAGGGGGGTKGPGGPSLSFSEGYPSFLEPESGLEISKMWGLFIVEAGHVIPSHPQIRDNPE